jgi:hypothetical protein
MDILAFIALIVTGFTSCAEFGSYAGRDINRRSDHPLQKRMRSGQHARKSFEGREYRT